MKEIIWYLRLAFVFTKKAVKAMLSYRFSFLINCISQALDYAVTFLLMWVMISAFDSMKGWKAYEVTERGSGSLRSLCCSMRSACSRMGLQEPFSLTL